MVARAEFLVNQPLQKDTFETAGFDASLVARRNLSDVEVAEQVPVHTGKIETWRIGRYGWILEKERVALFAGRLWLWRRHLQPSHRRGTGRAPRVHGADLERAKIARSDTVDVLANTQDRLSAQDVEAFLVRVDVRRDGATGRQFGDAETRVDGPG